MKQKKEAAEKGKSRKPKKQERKDAENPRGRKSAEAEERRGWTSYFFQPMPKPGRN